MPYFITDTAEGCSGWATIKDDGEVIGCHTTKQAAVDQMIAVSLAEDMEPGGERKKHKKAKPMKTMYRELPDNYRPALAEDVPEGRACGNCMFYDEDRVNEAGDKAWCEKWDEFVDGGYYCNAWQSDDDMDDMDEDDDDLRAINQDAPAYMRAAARRGLEYYADGKGGDGLVDKTIREARLMADGQVSDDKWVRTAAWIARHMPDLDSPDADPNSDNYPSAGVVAHLLWGSGPSKTKAIAAMEYAQRVAERVKTDEERHLSGKHDQKSHASGGKSAGINPEAGQGNIKITSEMASDFAGTSAGAHLRQNQDGSYAFTPERQALHDKIVSDAVAGVPVSTDPTYHVMGGGPAAGKSTMLKSSQVDVPGKDKAVQVNADDVKEKLPEWDRMEGDANRANYLHEESSYIAKRIQAAGFETNKDVVVDGTGDSSQSSMANKISKARAAGYKVKGSYATVPTDVAISRANARGKKTGRYVPEPVIRNTHAGVSDVFPKITGLFDEVSLWDTSGELKLLGSGKDGNFDVYDTDGYSAFLAKAGE